MVIYGAQITFMSSKFCSFLSFLQISGLTLKIKRRHLKFQEVKHTIKEQISSKSSFQVASKRTIGAFHRATAKHISKPDIQVFTQLRLGLLRDKLKNILWEIKKQQFVLLRHSHYAKNKI